MKRSISILMLFLMFFAMTNIDSVFATNSDSQASSIQMPTRSEVTKDSDVSYNMLKNLFGGIIPSVIGDSRDKTTTNYGGYGFTNVIDLLMGALNFCALAFLSCGILYTFAIGALTTAHEGKKLGGSVYNSLWVPVRAAFSFSLCVPVSHGYSLLQIAIITMMGFGINFANLAWDMAGSHIVTQTANVTSDSPSASVRNEARALMEPIFRNAVTFEIVTKSLGANLKTPQRRHFPADAKVDISDPPFVVVDDPYKGTITVQLWTTEKSNDYRDFGTVTIPRPQQREKYEQKYGGDDSKVYDAKLRIAYVRLEAIKKLWREMFKHADKYAYEKHNVIPAGGPRPSSDGHALMAQYMKAVGDAVNAEIAAIQKLTTNQEKLLQAIDSNGQKSMMGWATAGLFPFALSRIFKALDEVAFTGPAEFQEPEIKTDNEGFDLSWLSFEVTDLNQAQLRAIQKSPVYLNDVVMGGALFNEHAGGDGSGDSSTLNQVITKLWWASSWNQSKDGILKTTLNKFASEDPIIVITELGGRIYKMGFWMIIAKLSRDASDYFIVTKAFKWALDKITPIGIAGAMVDSGLFTTVAWLLLSTGVILKFIAPLTPLAIWLYAFLGWLLRVVETLIAAPLWAVAHAMPEGVGFAGNSARQGYFMVLDVGFRPILMVIGAILSIALWRIAGHGFAELATKALNAFTADDRDLDTQIILSVAVMVLFWVLYTKIFVALISTFPDRIMSWIGKNGGGSALGSPEQMGSQFNGAMMMISNRHDALMQNAMKGIGQGKGPELPHGGGPGSGPGGMKGGVMPGTSEIANMADKGESSTSNQLSGRTASTGRPGSMSSSSKGISEFGRQERQGGVKNISANESHEQSNHGSQGTIAPLSNSSGDQEIAGDAISNDKLDIGQMSGEIAIGDANPGPNDGPGASASNGNIAPIQDSGQKYMVSNDAGDKTSGQIGNRMAGPGGSSAGFKSNGDINVQSGKIAALEGNDLAGKVPGTTQDGRLSANINPAKATAGSPDAITPEMSQSAAAGGGKSGISESPMA